MNNKYDLIVIGAGVVGTFHAYHAAIKGKKVLLLEKDKLPVNASVRNFGMAIVSGMSGPSFDYGLQSTVLYKNIQQEFDISVRNNGSLYIASDEDEQQLLHELKAHYDTLGYEAMLLSQQEVLKKYNVIQASYCREALFFPQEISVEPHLFIHRLHQYCAAKFPNLTYQNGTPVVDCSATGNEFLLTTTSGKQFTAEKVVIASGHEFKLLFPGLFAKEDLSVTKLQMFRTVAMPQLPLEGNIATGLSIRRYESFAQCPSYKSIKTPEHLQELMKWGIHILFKKANDGTVIVGDSHEYAKIGEEEKLGYSINQHINNLMLKEAQRIVNFDMTKTTETWAGYYAFHRTKEAFDHDIDDKIFIRVAVGGKGMTCSAGYAAQTIKKIFG